MVETPNKKEHWSRHPAFITVLTVAMMNLGSIMAVVKFTTVSNIPLFIGIWILGAALSLVAGLAIPLYFIVGMFAKDVRKDGYLKFLFSIYRHLPMAMYTFAQEFIYEARTEAKTKKPQV